MRTPLIAGNWKMNNTVGMSMELIKKLKELVSDVKDREILVCPPFTALSAVSMELKTSDIKLGAQNIYYEDKGAFTGEISAGMLKELDCEYVIIGHSERRKYFNETNEIVNKKLKAALKNNLKAILCVGENLQQREKNTTKSVIGDHVKNSLKGLKSMNNVVIAYEPVWAIGTGKTATPEQAEEVHLYIRNMLREMFDDETAQQTRILYGGSVTPENIAGLMEKEDIDGALVGGASLDAEKFARIVQY